ncbi:hypothetical protein PVAND_002081 [Polypedilum vanderplanki]|uniref:Uncharacterized protein n=1 Tax=Polypedilum vanderplanki TaxID=319348 RepID=A0A9J6BQB6_POLVA|nr:hypothetical protein PVAND_002081 [Polypedilum vanderplanki]
MLRQSVSKLPVSLIRSTFSRSFASGKSPCGLCPEEEEQKQQNSQNNCDEKESQKEASEKICNEHAKMVPEFENLKNLKKFELKSNCNSFHWATEGHER